MDNLTRKQFLAASGAAAGGLVAANALGLTGAGPDSAAAADAAAGTDASTPTQQEIARALIENNWYLPVEDLQPDEIRISIMGSSFVPRVGQASNSVFIEVGTGQSFVFDCGSGVITKYTAMGIPSSRMTRVFLTHLHADHMSDLTTLYCFGPAHDRQTPLHVYGPSGPKLNGVEYTSQGTRAFCSALFTMCEWHRESMSFLRTGLKPCDEYPNGTDGYQLVAHELPYTWEGDKAVAYQDDDVTIRHFPAAHDRDGSISYRLEFNGMSVVFSGDTKPTTWMIKYGQDLDVLIHEMALSVNDWVTHQAATYPGDADYQELYDQMQEVQDNSHTPELAFGETLAACKPRLGVITHCHFNQDTFITAVDRLRKKYDGPLAWAIDTMVLNVRPGQPIKQRMALIPDFAWDLGSMTYPSDAYATPKYNGPYAQFSDFTMRHIPPEYKK
jgi:ribonuclease Z